jgi:ATP-dependent Clp protease ATP-binding subunit ClpA
MKTTASPKTRRLETSFFCSDLFGRLSEKIIGQPGALSAIVPYLETYQAGLAPKGRPAGVFLLLGPTGTGKTRTVEVLAELLHGSDKSVLRVDCGEFQMEHEVAKLIGAPPGYLGHRETQPWITQPKLNAVASESCELSVVLFDEIEKAAPSMMRLLLGVLDRATLRLGDASSVCFERALIFLTSNVGAREMMREILPAFGLGGGAATNEDARARRVDRAGAASLRKKFSPEFLNRVDAIISYSPLGPASLESILDLQIREFARLIDERLGPVAFRVEVLPEARQFLLAHGAAPEYGARELRRTLERHLAHPLAGMVARDAVAPGSIVRVTTAPGGAGLIFDCDEFSGGVSIIPARREDSDSIQRAARRKALAGEQAAASS